MLGRAASCCDLLRLSPTPGDSSEDDVFVLYYSVCVHCVFLFYFITRTDPIYAAMVTTTSLSNEEEFVVK